MIYEKMIETENSDPMRTAWTDYRQTLTSYVLEGIESYYRRAHLARQGKLRDQAFTLEADGKRILGSKAGDFLVENVLQDGNEVFTNRVFWIWKCWHPMCGLY